MKISEIKVIYSNKNKETVHVNSSESAYRVFKEHWNPDTIELQECFKVLYLNRANIVLGIVHHSVGGVTGTVVDVKLVIGTALKVVASGIIIAHNHPSANLRASEADKALTNKMKEAAKLFDIQLLDHLIITKEDYTSFADEGML